MQPTKLHPRQITIALFACLLTMSLATGCGHSDTGKVAGRVTLGGKPLDQGAIVFQGTTKGNAIISPLNPDGTYHVKTSKTDGLAPGDYQVAIQPRASFAGKIPLVTPQDRQKKSETSLIPAKYLSVTTSGLKATVKQGDNPPFDFDLQ
jgi:hypothetical protein